MTYQLHHGDALEFMATLPDESVDAVITDPPYGVAYDGRYGSDWGEILNDRDLGWLPEAARQMFRVLKPDSFMVSFYGWPNVHLFAPAWLEAGFVAKSHLVFVKNQWGLGYFTRGQHEAAFLLCKGKPKPPASVASDVIPWVREATTWHPTQKPLGVMRELISRFTSLGGVVLDPFAGSGSTGVAALMEARRFIGCELDPNYHALAAKRLEAAAAQPRLLEAS